VEEGEGVRGCKNTSGGVKILYLLDGMGGGRQVVVLHVLARAKRKRRTDLLKGSCQFCQSRCTIFNNLELLQGATQINLFIYIFRQQTQLLPFFSVDSRWQQVERKKE
jgi:hypothetical protein